MEQKHSTGRHARRAPAHSIWYDRLVPIVFILLALLMATILVVAIGVLVGIIPYR